MTKTDAKRLVELKRDWEDIYERGTYDFAYPEIIGRIIDLISEQVERVQELEGQLQGLNIMYDVRLAKSDKLEQRSKRLREAMESAVSEIKYALYSNKSKVVKEHYLRNAETYIAEALEGGE